MSLSPDVIVLATLEMTGMPFVVLGLVATGGFASALSAADGLLPTMAGTNSHDFFYRIVRPQASPQLRLVTSKIILLMVAALAATVAAERPASILPTVAWAFSIAASAFFPPLALASSGGGPIVPASLPACSSACWSPATTCSVSNGSTCRGSASSPRPLASSGCRPPS
ncbi:MAG TPA: hypothetical protein VK165_19475 [Azonexus sp.]|nr:hypothetical protein [Azonexus sp.]